MKDLAVRWVEEDARIGVNPDVAVLCPRPRSKRGARERPEPGCQATSLPRWRSGVEPVPSHKDYSIVPPKYAASGTTELWIFDPLLCGTSLYGGPLRLQIYRRDAAGHFARIYAGRPRLLARARRVDGPGPTTIRMLRITADTAATQFWLTGEEAERAEKDAAVARIAELEAELARRGGASSLPLLRVLRVAPLAQKARRLLGPFLGGPVPVRVARRSRATKSRIAPRIDGRNGPPRSRRGGPRP